MSLNRSDLYTIGRKTEEALKKAGTYIMDSWKKIKKISYKDRRDVVTNVDIEVEEMLRKRLRDIFPQAGFLVEEGRSEKRSEYNWVIDPIDGTKNYVAQLPMFFTQIALAQKDEPILGQIYNPVSGQFFSASKDNGAYLDGKKIELQLRTDPRKAIAEVDSGDFDRDTEWKLKIFAKLAQEFYRVRMTAGFLFPYLTTGAADGYTSLDRNLKIVDILPGKVILRESYLRAEFVDLRGGRRVFVAGGEKIFRLIVDTLRS